MPSRIIEIVAGSGYADTLAATAEKYGALDWRADQPNGKGTQLFRILAHPERQQELIDQLQAALGKDKAWRLTILPVDATIPEPELSPDAKRAPELATREELYVDIAHGAEASRTFLLLVLISTVVAAIGLFEDNIAVVIGAMLIAPLLGPNVALAFGSAIGDRQLITRAASTNLIGIALSIAGAALAGLVLPNQYSGPELVSRTVIGFDSVALALASGAAGALSLTSGLSSTLVGVMVAVALLPPAATFGYMLGTGRFELAMGAGALLAVNIVCVNLAAQLVFLAKGIKPRTWLERRSAQQSTRISLIVWSVLLAILLASIYLRRG
ncbi:MAG: TIGR00341 family protein [Dongiaceae bacterium]